MIFEANSVMGVGFPSEKWPGEWINKVKNTDTITARPAKYGDKLAFHGGINAQIWDKPELVLSEMERIIPALKEGSGYIFASDHSIPNSVSLENMTKIAKLAHKLGKY